MVTFEVSDLSMTKVNLTLDYILFQTEQIASPTNDFPFLFPFFRGRKRFVSEGDGGRIKPVNLLARDF